MLTETTFQRPGGSMELIIEIHLTAKISGIPFWITWSVCIVLQRRQITHKGVHGFVVRCNRHKMSFPHQTCALKCPSCGTPGLLARKQSGRHTGLLINKSASNCWPSGVFESIKSICSLMFCWPKMSAAMDMKRTGMLWEKCVLKAQLCYSLKSNLCRCFPPVHSANLSTLSNQMIEMYSKILHGHALHL